jgi:hypothetical protein
MTISNPFFLVALVVFMAANVVVGILRLNAARRTVKTLKLQREERQKNEEAAKLRLKENEARAKEAAARNEANAARSETNAARNDRVLLLAESTQKRAEENQERWEKVITRLEALMDRIERQNNG